MDFVAKQFIAMFESMQDAYLKERASDIRDVTSRLLYSLLKKNKISDTNSFNFFVQVNDPSNGGLDLDVMLGPC